ncbi:MAG TPA: hypothetical protein VMW28_03190 [Pelolinea sp.]|nr:hypothetical protein [Pelolinea sp.]
MINTSRGAGRDRPGPHPARPPAAGAGKPHHYAPYRQRQLRHRIAHVCDVGGKPAGGIKRRAAAELRESGSIFKK